MSDKSYRDDEWTLYSDVPDVDYFDTLSREERAEINNKIHEKIELGLNKAAKELGIDATAIMSEQFPGNMRSGMVRLNLPDVQFNSLFCKGNLCTFRSTNPVSGSITIWLSGDGRHPHCDDDDDGHYCWSYGIHVTEYIKREMFEMALLALIDVTQTYIPGTSYKKPDGSLMCRIEGCRNYGVTPDPRLGLSENVATYEQYVCRKHSRVCKVAGCSDMASHSHNGYDICDKHYESIECSNCHNHVPIETTTLSSNGRYSGVEAVHCTQCSVVCTRCGYFTDKDVAVLYYKEFYCRECLSVKIVRTIIPHSSSRWKNFNEVIKWQEERKTGHLVKQ